MSRIHDGGLLTRGESHSGAASRGLPEGVAKLAFLGRLSGGLVDELIQSSHSVTYPTGSIIETPARAGLALIVSGALRYYLSAADGRQLTVGYLGPGSVLGTVEKESASIVRVQVIAPTVLLHLQADRVQSLIQRRPELTQALLEEAIHGLKHSFRVLAASAFMTVRARVARDLIERASLSGPLLAGVHLMVTQQALADATGSVREVVARSLRELARNGVIATGGGGGVTIRDPDALMRVAGYVT
jgi:CRP-like cAMP-binding protein